LADEAQRILEHARRTRYQSEPNVDAKAGTYELDCAAFVGLLLESVAPEHLAHIAKGANERYPRAFELFEFLHAKAPEGWSHVESLAKVERGDVIAWRAERVSPGRESGHVLVVAQAPVIEKAPHTWTVHAYDSSAHAHHGDSRERAGKFHPGLGEGDLRFKVDSSGAPVAFQFGPHAEFHTVPIVVARLRELPAKSSVLPRHEEAAHHPHEAAHRHEEAPRPPHSATGPVPGAHTIERAAVANDVLKQGEYAIATYVLAVTDAILLPAAVVAYWGPGQTILPSVGQGSSQYALAGGVVFRNR
jgi:hypothetical protein